MSGEGGAAEAQASNQPVTGVTSASPGAAVLALKRRLQGHRQQDPPPTESSLNFRFGDLTLLNHCLWDLTLQSAFFTSSFSDSDLLSNLRTEMHSQLS